MKLSDLKTGMRVRMRDDRLYIVMLDIERHPGTKDILFAGLTFHDFNYGCYYNDDMTSKGTDSNSDIVEVYYIMHGGMFELDNMPASIWTRKESKEMTVAEISKELGYEVKVVEG